MHCSNASPGKTSDTVGSIRISAGACVFPHDAQTVEEFERRTDSALYWAKHQGKHRSCLYDATIVRQPSPEELARAAARKARLQAAEYFIRVVDAKDTYTGAHSQSVARLAEGIAMELALDHETVEQIRLAGLLHDLGKIGLPDDVLKKPGDRSTPQGGS